MAQKPLNQTESESRFCNITSQFERNVEPIQELSTIPLVRLNEAIQSLIPLVPEIDQMMEKLEEYYKVSTSHLSEDEIKSIMLYTLEWKPYDSSFYYILNATLRLQDPQKLKPWLYYLRLFINALSKLPKNKEPVVFRGIQMDLSNEYFDGKEIIWPSFTSCTLSLSILEKYISTKGTRTIFNIVSHSAKDISQYSCYNDEKEVLCYPGTKFRVKSSLNAGNQLHIILLEEILAEEFLFHIPEVSNWSNEQSNYIDHNLLKRTAIDLQGNLGYLYDINRDCLLTQLNTNDLQQSSQLYQTIECQITNGDTNTTENLLKMIGIQDDLRLSILLSFPPKTGIASIIDYPLPIDKYTRFLYYSYTDREERLPNEISKIQNSNKSLLSTTDATHMITGMTLGIEFIVALQLPPDKKLVRKIDSVLQTIQDIFKGNQNSLTLDDEAIVNSIVNTKIYSNLVQLTQMTSLLDLCRCRDIAKKTSYILYPLVYYLQPVETFFPQNNHSRMIFIHPSTNLTNKVEQHLLKISTLIKQSKYSFNEHMNSLSSQHLQERLTDLQNQFETIENIYKQELSYFQNLIFLIRMGQDDISEIDQLLKKSKQINFEDRIQQFQQNLDDLVAKERFINDLQEHHFQYYNVEKYHITHNDNEQTLKHKLIKDHQRDRILCLNDHLYTNNQTQFNQLYNKLIQEHEHNPDLNLIYADFTYSSFQLQEPLILSSKKLINTKQNRSVSLSGSVRSLNFSDEYLNILLLGETQVGKSTFINSFINYLKYETFDQVESSNPIVLIPVSFSLTNSSQQISQASDIDRSGQSVTQHCKSYVFPLHRYNGKKLRLIDTCGFGDRRSVEQYNRHIEDILQYISHSSYLHGICFLLKSNTREIPTYFQICLSQLMNFLGPTARKSLLFCLTDTRLNTFNLENTIRLLQPIIKDIPIKKEHIFSFDNESFRYFIARKHGVRFHINERKQYEISWSNSLIELNRFIDYICLNLPPCRLQGNEQSIKQVQFEIVPLIRPILETIRNIFRNLILHDNKSTKFIQLKPKVLHRNASKCCLCTPHVSQIDQFWIVDDIPHEIEERCYTCPCSSSQHIQLDYLLEYEFSNELFNYQYERTEMLTKLCFASFEFAFFLMYAARSTKDDPVSSILTQMINEENNICLSKKPNHLNLLLINELKTIKTKHENQINQMKNNHQFSTSTDIYKYIRTIREYPIIRQQLIAIKQGQDIRMKQYDYEFSNDLSLHRTTSF